MVSMLEKFGVITLCVLGIQLTRIMSDFLYRRSIARHYSQRRLRDLGQWGVVLGADNSIGQAYAVELAKQGLDVVLMGSNPIKLAKLSSLLEKYFQVFTGVISLTFSSNEFTYIERALHHLDVAVLVNAPDYAEGISHAEHMLKVPHFDVAASSVINRNLTAVTKMCAIVMPGMVSRGKGIIVNVSSVASKTCPPLSASAAYVHKLTEELRNEYSSSGVIVQSLLPGCVLSDRPNFKTKFWVMPSPRDYVGSAVRRLQARGKASSCSPHTAIHGALLWLRGLCPKATVCVAKKVWKFFRRGAFATFSSAS